MSAKDQIAAFRRLHETGCFVIPNPWDIGSARLLAGMGFRALATTSAGLSFTLGRPDHPAALSLSEVLDNVRDIVDATPLPVSADFQAGYGDDAETIARNVTRCIELGVAGLSMEDACARDGALLFELEEAVDRVRAARAAIDASGRGVVLTGRAECFLVGHDHPLRESVRRLVAYAEAGADCLYAPGLRTREQITTVVKAVAPKPVNVLVTDPLGMSLASLAELGVRRISVGSAMVRAALGTFIAVARELSEGTFTALADAEPFATFNRAFERARA